MQTPLQREVQRYAARFRGRCQAVGEDDAQSPDDDAISWLFSGARIVTL